jgi:hypothetical protein
MDARLQELVDHHEIRKTLADYCQGCDRCDELRMASVYAEDSWDDHGGIKASGPEFSRQMAARILEIYDIMYHILGQSIIRVDGDEAGAETYFIGVARSGGDDGPERMCNQVGGRFIDRLVRVGDGWKIKERTVVGDWTIALPIEHEWAPALHLRPGLKSGDDPAFAVLARKLGEIA